MDHLCPDRLSGDKPAAEDSEYYSLLCQDSYFPGQKVNGRLEPIVLKNLPIIPSRTSEKFYPLNLFTYYSFIILLILLNQ